MTKNMAVVWQSIRLSFLRDSEYSGDIITSFVHFWVQIGVSIVYWLALTDRFSTIGPWGLPELVLLSAMSNLSPLLDLFYLGFRDLPAKVLRGDLDKFLYRPCNPIIGLLSENLYMRYPVYQALTALILMGWALTVFDLSVTLANAGVALVLLMLGVFVMRMFNGTVTLSVFWLGKIGNVQMVLGSFGSLSRYPVTIYGNAARRALTYFLPYGLVATYPTLALLGWRPPGWFWLCMLGVLGLWTSVFLIVWRAALRRYEAYGG